MSSLSFSYMSGVLGVHVTEPAEGVQILQPTHSVGLTIIQNGITYNFEVNPIGLPGLFGTDRVVSWAIKPELLKGATVYTALWKGIPTGDPASAICLNRIQAQGDDILRTSQESPIAVIGDTAVGAVENVFGAAEGVAGGLKNISQYLPWIAVGVGAYLLITAVENRRGLL